MEQQPWFEFEDYQTRPCFLGMTPPQQELIRQFRQDGYIIIDETGIELSTIDEAVKSLAGHYTGSATGYSGGGRIQDAWKKNPSVKSIATAVSMLKILQLIYQKDPMPFQTLNFERGTQQRAHSDTIHFSTLPQGFMCGVWVALEDTDANNGPLFYYPGSQRLPVFEMEELGLEAKASEYQKYEECVGKILEGKGYQPRQAHLKKGQALIWSSNIFHGGSKILDPSRTRQSQVTHYYFPGCVYYTPMFSNPQKQLWFLREVTNMLTEETVPCYQGLHQSLIKASLEMLRKMRF